MGVEFISGNIGCGKTSDLIIRLKNEQNLGKKVTLFRPSSDIRKLNGTADTLDDCVASRLGLSIKSIPQKNALSIIEYVHNLDDKGVKAWEETIGITEVPLFSEDGQMFIDFAKEYGKKDRRIIMDGLLTTFTGDLFPFGDSGRYVCEIIPFAEHTEKPGKCFYRLKEGRACEAPARYNLRLLNGFPAPRDAPLISVGSEKGKMVEYDKEKMVEQYLGVCKIHHFVPENKYEWKDLEKKYNFPQPNPIRSESERMVVPLTK